jgi:hypothetical protein
LTLVRGEKISHRLTQTDTDVKINKINPQITQITQIKLKAQRANKD